MVKSRPGGEGDPVGKIPGKPVTLGGQHRSDDRARQVSGDGMRGRLRDVNQGDLPETRWAKSPSGRSQSTHKSEEAG
jgi:hypothetical protein